LEIDNLRQNKPSLVAKDLLDYVPFNITMRSLLNRGIFKWLSVRLSLIRLKDSWKKKINDIAKDHNRLYYMKGYLKAYEECRKEIRLLCHSPRWQAPISDRKSIEFLQAEWNRINKNIGDEKV